MERSSTPEKPQRRAADTKLTQGGLSVLELSKEMGNVAEACHQRELNGTSFHEWKRQLQTRGFERLRNLPPIDRSHPQATPPEVVERFNGAVLNEFFQASLREDFCDSVEALQADLDAGLAHHNSEQPHLGHRNRGRRPVETVMSLVSQEG